MVLGVWAMKSWHTMVDVCEHYAYLVMIRMRATYV